MNEYKVEKSKISVYGIIEERYCITENRLPMLTISQWLDNVSLESILTGKHYAYTLVGFLRYINSNGLSYKQVKSKVVIWNYMKKLMYEDKKNSTIGVKGQKSHNSIYHSINIICNFYFWLDQYINGIVNLKKSIVLMISHLNIFIEIFGARNILIGVKDRILLLSYSLSKRGKAIDGIQRKS